jgi:hypothetical protein
MLKFGQNGGIDMEAIFATNLPKYHLFNSFAFDDWKNDIFMAGVLTCRTKEEGIMIWLEPLRRHLEKHMPNFLPSCLIPKILCFLFPKTPTTWGMS